MGKIGTYNNQILKWPILYPLHIWKLHILMATGSNKLCVENQGAVLKTRGDLVQRAFLRGKIGT
jgi:hypothetical protein